ATGSAGRSRRRRARWPRGESRKRAPDWDFRCLTRQPLRHLGLMEIDKQQVIELLRKEGKNEHVQKAIDELPEKIDHEQHAHLLEKFGIDPGKLAASAAHGVVG